MKYFRFLLLGCFVVVAVVNCSTKTYFKKISYVRKNIRLGEINLLKDTKFCEADRNLLCLLESAKLSQFLGDNTNSIKFYSQVIQHINDSRLQPAIQISSVLENINALLLNDSVLSYLISDYELSFIYVYQAFNFLVKQDLEKAVVSIKQLNNMKKWISNTNQAKNNLKNDYQQYFKKLNIEVDKLAVNSVKKHNNISYFGDNIPLYENALSYYLASILYEAYDSNYNNAFLAIKLAKKIQPNNEYILQTYTQMEEKISGKVNSKNIGRLVVVYEQGLVDSKKSFEMSLFLGDLGIQKVSLPYYGPYNLPSLVNIEISQHGEIISKEKMALLVDVNKLSRASLLKEYNTIIVREIVRLILKSTIVLQSGQKNYFFSDILYSLYGIITSKADIRSWSLLPGDVQLYTKNLQVGEYNINIDGLSNNFLIKEGKNTVLWVVKIGKFNKTYGFSF